MQLNSSVNQLILLNNDLSECTYTFKYEELNLLWYLAEQINSDLESFSVTLQDKELISLADTMWLSYFKSFDYQKEYSITESKYIFTEKHETPIETTLLINSKAIPLLKQSLRFKLITTEKLAKITNNFTFNLLFIVVSSSTYLNATRGEIKVNFQLYSKFLELENTSYSSFNNFRQKLIVPAMTELLNLGIVTKLEVNKITNSDYFKVIWEL